MNDWCVDSSVVAKWVLAEPDSAAALRVFIDSNAKGGKLFVLDLAILEVANAIRTRHHRGLRCLLLPSDTWERLA